jgi:DNA polymerase III subunit chi
MPQVDFYILPDAAAEQRALFACRLAEKVYKLGHRVYLHIDDEASARQLDELLWRHQASSFVPHALRIEENQNPAQQSPVQIGWQTDVEQAAGSTVLINLAAAVPSFFGNFQRISEIVVQIPEVLTATRNAWRHYQQQGCSLERHDLRPAPH